MQCSVVTVLKFADISSTNSKVKFCMRLIWHSTMKAYGGSGCIDSCLLRFAVFTAMAMMNAVFWDVTQWESC
jgi:hypothetical protein